MSGRSLGYDVHIVKKKSGPFGCRVLGFHRRNYDISVIFLLVRSKKIHRKVLTIFHFIFYVYFFRSNIFSLGWGGEIPVLCISCMVLRLWEIYFSSVSIFLNNTYFNLFQKLTAIQPLLNS